MESCFTEQTLPNGLRIICETMPRVSSAAVGFFVRTGSRHESPAEHGISHFLEHMCFKGTQRRTWREINVRFDDLGSIYNAFTSKEHTFYFGWVPAERVDDQLELLADILRPALPAEEYETERKVILEEIAMSGDSFDHHVWDFLHNVCFANHPLAHEILGERESLLEMPREKMVDYLARRYATDNVTLLAAGALDAERVFASAERYCRDWRPSDNGATKTTPPQAAPVGVRKKQLEQFTQQSVILLFPAPPDGGNETETIEAFQALFGGANSRCFWNIVQKGICSAAGAAWVSYADCGLMALYADGEPERCEQMIDALREQARDVTQNGFRAEEVQRVRNRRRTQLALEAENPRTRLMQLTDDLESLGHVRTAEARLAAVEAVTERTIADFLDRYPITGDGLLLSCGPRDWPE